MLLLLLKLCRIAIELIVVSMLLLVLVFIYALLGTFLDWQSLLVLKLMHLLIMKLI